MEIKHNVKAWSDLDKEQIHLSTETQDLFNQKMVEVSRQMIDLKEKAVREQLIALGWRPPVEEQDE